MGTSGLNERTHQVDFCVVGGGLSGMCATIAAARHGLRVALVHDRPVLGGNASSEIRMWIFGARGRNNRETGIIEEILLENRYRNPLRNYALWDSVLYEMVRFQQDVTLLRPGSCDSWALSHAVRAAVRASEARASGGKYTEDDVVWHLDAAELDGSPRPGDVIVQGDAGRWTVLAARRSATGRWRCVCRELAIEHGLDQYVDIEVTLTNTQNLDRSDADGVGAVLCALG